MPVTFLYAGLLGLLAVLLANQVLRARVRPNQPDWKESTTLRVQANFVENVPRALILLCAVECSTGSTLAVHVLGSALVSCRLLHAFGISRNPGANYPGVVSHECPGSDTCETLRPACVGVVGCGRGHASPAIEYPGASRPSLTGHEPAHEAHWRARHLRAHLGDERDLGQRLL